MSSIPRPAVRLITQWWSPEPVTVPVWMAKALSAKGWDVDVLTGVPNYPTGTVAEGYSGARFRRESSEGFEVRRAPLYPSHDASVVRRMANYLSWATTAVIPAIIAPRVDVNLVYSSPATAAIPALAARLVRRTPYIMVIQDIWPDSVTRGGFVRAGTFVRLMDLVLRQFVRLAYAGASGISVISPGAVDVLHARGVPRQKLQLIFNWVDEEIFRPTERDDVMRRQIAERSDDFVLMYAGNLGSAQGLEIAIRALTHAPANVRLVLAGDGVEEAGLRALADEVAPGRVTFLGRRPVDEMGRWSAAADAQLVILRDLPLFRTTMPSKVQASLASGTPIICAVAGDAAVVVDRSGAGLTVPPEDPRALGEALGIMAAMPRASRAEYGRRGHKWYRREMAQAVGVERLDALLRHAIERKRDS